MRVVAVMVGGSGPLTPLKGGNENGFCEGWCDGFRGCFIIMGTYPLAPFLRGRGNADRFCEGWCDGVFNRMMHWVKAIKTAIVFILQASYAPSFLLGKGAGG